MVWTASVMEVMQIDSQRLRRFSRRYSISELYGGAMKSSFDLLRLVKSLKQVIGRGLFWSKGY